MSSSDGNFGTANNEPLSIETLFGASWPAVLQACLQNNCDRDFRPFRTALATNHGANNQAQLIFSALEDALNILGQDVSALQEQVNTGDALNANLRSQLQNAQGRVEAYEGGIGSLARSFEQGIQGFTSAASTREPTQPLSLVADPDRFNGDEKDDKKRRREFRAWQGGARIKINMETKKYNTEYHKIIYVCSRLSGSARIAVDSYLMNIYKNPGNSAAWEWANSEALFDWLERAYDSHNRSGNASREMDDLKQKNTAFNVFLSEFLALTADLGLDDKAKIEKLKKKVNNELQSAVISVFPKPQNEDFDGWVDCYRSLTENIMDYAHYTGNKNPFLNNPFNKDNNKNKNGNNNQNNQHGNHQHGQQPPRPHTPAPAGDPIDLDAIKF
ncbi:Uu.00g125040.m01.CDS01 [Anthostomella pinea]|uniref:Uu.00g125040.m01.CDS01 n=1 Tax=Anthostomella pinea TaxID=933095 RepID=A0AAI8VIN0_9PEZI|nr:Uu.00g125040.m01.CDS01 [Anthostomella pinea]